MYLMVAAQKMKFVAPGIYRPVSGRLGGDDEGCSIFGARSAGYRRASCRGVGGVRRTRNWRRGAEADSILYMAASKEGYVP